MRGKKILRLGLLLLSLLLLLCLSAQGESYRTLKVGSEGRDVLRLKTAMYWLGYFKTDSLSDAYTSQTAERVKMLQKNNGLEETGVADAELQELIYSGLCVPGDMGPTPSPVPPPTPSPTPEPTPVPLPPRTEEGFLQGAEAGEEYILADGENGCWIYLSASLSVEVYRRTDPDVPLVWYEADIRCSPETPLVSYVNGNRGASMISPMTFARNNQIVLAMSDDHFSHRINEKGVDGTAGLIIREGRIVADDTTKPKNICSLDLLAVFEDGSMKTFRRREHTAQEYLDMGVKSTYSFGPILIQDGELTEYATRTDYYAYREPRMALGMIEPYHYYVLCVEGRQEGRSRGVFLNWLGENMMKKGVREAINLDGGGTAILVFMGEKITKSGVSTRSVGSMTGFGVSSQVPEK